ncbi:hypothetical protein ACFVSN_27645 [Kitasatospora sp. NPDC057904]|uniref:hypothetical protein n=1 Tax=Kitasatospora sp. NPDC057904 TaxID=3346275 RepID=UPI0036DD775F
MTINDHDELAAHLTALADAPAPPAAFDVATSISRGRARLRRRRQAAVGALAAMTAATVTAALLLAPGGGLHATQLLPAGTPRESATPTPGEPVGSPTNPLIISGRFGWLPDWLDPARDVGYLADGSTVVTKAGQGGPSGRRLDLLVHPAGAEPRLTETSQSKPEKDPAPPVNGRTAYWITDPTHPTFDSGRRILCWQTASGRWAQLVSNRPRGGEVPDDVLLRIAADVQTGEWPAALPFWLSGLPEGLRPNQADLSRPAAGQPWSAGAAFSVGEMTIAFIVAPAGKLEFGKSETVCREEQGLQICATTEGGSKPLLDKFGGLEGLTRMVHPTGVDPSTWTTDVIR